MMKHIPITLAIRLSFLAVVALMALFLRGDVELALYAFTVTIAVIIVRVSVSYLFGALSRIRFPGEEVGQAGDLAGRGSARMGRYENAAELQSITRRPLPGVTAFLLKVADYPVWQREGTIALLAIALALLVSLCVEGTVKLTRSYLTVAAAIFLVLSLVLRYFINALRRYEYSGGEVDAASVMAEPHNPVLERRIRQLDSIQKKRRRDRQARKRHKRRKRQ